MNYVTAWTGRGGWSKLQPATRGQSKRFGFTFEEVLCNPSLCTVSDLNTDVFCSRQHLLQSDTLKPKRQHRQSLRGHFKGSFKSWLRKMDPRNILLIKDVCKRFETDHKDLEADSDFEISVKMVLDDLENISEMWLDCLYNKYFDLKQKNF